MEPGYTQRFGLVYVDYQTRPAHSQGFGAVVRGDHPLNGEHVGRVEPVSEENG